MRRVFLSIVFDIHGSLGSGQASKGNDVRNGVAPKAVRAMHTTSGFTCGIQALDRISIVALYPGSNVNHHPAHGVVNRRGHLNGIVRCGGQFPGEVRALKLGVLSNFYKPVVGRYGACQIGGGSVEAG